MGVHHFLFIFLPLGFVCNFLATDALTANNERPNIVFILTDDQDFVLGGMHPLSKTKELIGDAGIVFENSFATSPLCCPSRSSILTGNYVHNHGALTNSIHGNCSSPAWQQNSEIHGFATHVKKQGYKTFFAGKYLNKYGKPLAGGVRHVPPGWDDWNGLVGNSVYYNYKLSVNGKAEKHRGRYPADYLPHLIGLRAEEFLEDEALLSSPFFMMLSTPAPHSPFTPEPKYKDIFSDVSAPRDGSFNVKGKDKHWLLRQVQTPMSNISITYIDEAYRNRWRTLLTVDDMVENIVNILKDKHLLDNTYIIYTSDNGFHLGQFSLPKGKRQLYEFDIRVPLMVRGPGIQAGQVRKEIILNIDFAPTFVDLAGETPPSTMDGQSFKSLLLSTDSDPDSWRTDFMVEHTGGARSVIPGCPHLDNQNVDNCFPDCICEDSLNNTYSCVRTISKTQNLMYCEFADAENFVEVYNLTSDPHQLDNVVETIDPKVLEKQKGRLVALSECAGATCQAKMLSTVSASKQLQVESMTSKAETVSRSQQNGMHAQKRMPAWKRKQSMTKKTFYGSDLMGFPIRQL